MAPTAGIARTTDEAEAHVGAQVRELRLRADLTQEELARNANISVSALRALEHGAGSSLATVVSVVRALGRSEWLDALAPPAIESPLAKLAAARAAAAGTRQRATGSRARRGGM